LIGLLNVSHFEFPPRFTDPARDVFDLNHDLIVKHQAQGFHQALSPCKISQIDFHSADRLRFTVLRCAVRFGSDSRFNSLTDRFFSLGFVHG